MVEIAEKATFSWACRNTLECMRFLEIVSVRGANETPSVVPVTLQALTDS